MSFTAATGANTLAFTVYDGASGTGNVVGSYSTTVIAQPNSLNTFNLTPNGTVDHVNLTLASTTINAGTPGDVALTVDAKDKDNNTIIGPGNYVDANGTGIALFLSTTDSQAGGRGTVTINGPRVITAPGQRAIYAHYDGNWLDHTDIAVRASRNLAGVLNGATLTTVPNVATMNTAVLVPDDITLGPDGNMWISDLGYAIVKISQSGNATFYPVPTGGAQPTAILPGPDGKLWFTEASGKVAVGNISTSGAYTEWNIPAISFGIAIGQDGNLWFTLAGSASQINRITTSGIQTAFTSGISANAGLIRMRLGSDGRLWFTESNIDKIGAITTAGGVTEYSTGITSGAYPNDIALGPDGNMWFTESNGNRIGRITTNGVVTEFSAGLTAMAGPGYIVAGPGSKMWFVEPNLKKIASIDMNGTITEFSPSFSGKPYALALGPDGNLWVCEGSPDAISKFTL